MVEGTAGNTGIGLAHICKALGYHCVIFMPDTQSQVPAVHVCMCMCEQSFFFLDLCLLLYVYVQLYIKHEYGHNHSDLMTLVLCYVKTRNM